MNINPQWRWLALPVLLAGVGVQILLAWTQKYSPQLRKAKITTRSPRN